MYVLFTGIGKKHESNRTEHYSHILLRRTRESIEAHGCDIDGAGSQLPCLRRKQVRNMYSLYKLCVVF